MQTRSLLLCAIALLPLIGSRGLSLEKLFDVTGVVSAPLDNTGRLVVAHDDIPGFMPAMTMGFNVSDLTNAALLRAGDHVRFQIRVDDKLTSAEGFIVLGHSSSTPIVKTLGAGTPRLREGDRVPDYTCVSQSGQALTTARFKDHTTLVTFIFTRCPLPEYCPAMTLRFGQLQKAILADPQLAGHAQLLSISLDPEFDQPAVLKAYGNAVGADFSVWEFATGPKEEIARLTKSFAVYTERNGVTLDHTLCTALIDNEGRVVEIWRGNGWRTDEVLTSLIKAASNAAGNRSP